MLIYDYGPLAWFWRALISMGIVSGGLGLTLALRHSDVLPFLVSLPLVLPAVVFSVLVAVRIRVDPQGMLSVSTLSFLRRRIPRSRLRGVKVSEWATGSHGARVLAPRAWVKVHRSLPIYLDLYARIPDRGAFLKAIPIPPRHVKTTKTTESSDE